MCHKSLVLSTLQEKDFCYFTRERLLHSNKWRESLLPATLAQTKTITLLQVPFSSLWNKIATIGLLHVPFISTLGHILRYGQKTFHFFKYFTVQNVCTENCALLHMSLIPTLSATFLHRKFLQKQFPCVFQVPVQHFTLSKILTKPWHSSQPWATCNVQYSLRNFCIPARVTRLYS